MCQFEVWTCSRQSVTISYHHQLPAGELPVSGCLSLSVGYEPHGPEHTHTHRVRAWTRCCSGFQLKLTMFLCHMLQILQQSMVHHGIHWAPSDVTHTHLHTGSSNLSSPLHLLTGAQLFLHGWTDLTSFKLQLTTTHVCLQSELHEKTTIKLLTAHVFL